MEAPAWQGLLAECSDFDSVKFFDQLLTLPVQGRRQVTEVSEEPIGDGDFHICAPMGIVAPEVAAVRRIGSSGYGCRRVAWGGWGRGSSAVTRPREKEPVGGGGRGSAGGDPEVGASHPLG